MVRDAGRLGLSGDRFWQLTPAELWSAFEIAARRQKDAFERDTTLAWQIVRIYVETRGTERLAPLSQYLTPGRTGPQSPRDMLSVIKGIPALASRLSSKKE